MKKLFFVLFIAGAAMVASCGRNAQKATAKTADTEIAAPASEACPGKTGDCAAQAGECAGQCKDCPAAQGQPCDGTCGCKAGADCAKADCPKAGCPADKADCPAEGCKAGSPCK